MRVLYIIKESVHTDKKEKHKIFSKFLATKFNIHCDRLYHHLHNTEPPHRKLTPTSDYSI